MLKIDTAITLPETSGKGRSLGAGKYPFRYMGIGDSFFVPDFTTTKLLSASRWVRVEKGFKFTARKENDGARIWRVA